MIEMTLCDVTMSDLVNSGVDQIYLKIEINLLQNKDLIMTLRGRPQ